MSDELTAGQRVALAVEAGGTKADAEAHGAPYASVKRGRAVKKQRPDLFEKVRLGEMSDSTAAKIMAKDKSNELPVHPAAAAFPPLSKEEMDKLRNSLAGGYKVGIGGRVLLHRDGRIMDGVHRVTICAELGIPYESEVWEGSEEGIAEEVVARNLARRSLNESQRALVATRLAKLPKGAGGHRSNASPDAFSQFDAAKALNVGRATVQRAKRVDESGDKKLIAEVESGKKTVTQAARSLGTTKPTTHRKAGKASAPSPAPAPVAPRISSIAHPTLADTAGQVTQFANRLAEISERVSAAELLAGFPTELREKIGLSVPQAAEFLVALWEAHVATTKNAADGPAASFNLN